MELFAEKYRPLFELVNALAADCESSDYQTKTEALTALATLHDKVGDLDDKFLNDDEDWGEDWGGDEEDDEVDEDDWTEEELEADEDDD